MHHPGTPAPGAPRHRQQYSALSGLTHHGARSREAPVVHLDWPIGGPVSRRLVVVADDLGASPAINRGVLEAHRNGIVTAASLLVGMQHTQVAVEQARDLGLPLGLHLRLTLGAPLTHGPARVGLCDDGEFLPPLRFLGRLASGGSDLQEALATELRAQMDAFLTLVPQPDHINAHHHLHVHPAVLAPLIQVARDFDFPALRWPVEPMGSRGSATRTGEAIALRLLATRGRYMLGESALKTSDHFRGLRLMDGRLTTERLCHVLETLTEGTTELMVHPALGDGASKAGIREADTLRHPDVAAAIQAKGVELMSFREAVAWGQPSTGRTP
ncbi:MAG TPA: hypothetical protein DIU15_07390 [Deltaproteobacteria bacterium]|nr:hypothetical protein [Deltaproteobacteria bacterium]